jgi:hypothetical protein
MVIPLSAELLFMAAIKVGQFDINPTRFAAKPIL